MLSNVLSELDRSQVRAMSTELAALALGGVYELPQRHVEMPMGPTGLDDYLGEYLNEGNASDSFALAKDGNRLMVHIPPECMVVNGLWGDDVHAAMIR